MMDTLLADLRLWQGKLEEAHGFAEKARNRFKKLNDRFGLIQALAPLVRSQVALGRFAASQRSSEELISLAETGRQGPFPLMAVAGAAMHRGNGNIAEAMAQRALAEMRITGSQAFEPTVILAAALVQQGRAEEALAAIESVPEHGLAHPFTRAVAALVHVVSGQPDLALEAANAVADTEGATYLDQVFAYVAAAGAHSQHGDLVQAELAAQAAVAVAIGVGDVVATCIATATFQSVTGRVHPAFDDRTQMGDGWEYVVQQLARQPA
jgi:hypothetical protein